ADPGFHGKLTNIDVADDPTILHISIDKSARIHSDISREILALSQTKTTAENEISSRNPPAVGEESRSAERKLPERAAQAGKRATQ
ncbi:MAG: hypothetical protein WAZ97_25645, partial [Pseudolabrys sp.]